MYLARPHHPSEPTNTSDSPIVTVKSLLETWGEAALAELDRETGLTPHGAVARLLGLMSEAEPHLMVLEYSRRAGAHPRAAVCA